MIPKSLDQVDENDLSNLINSGVAESRTLDYKQQLPEMDDSGKRELLADVSSFANSSGGDLIFGMSEEAGVPTTLLGCQIGDVDQYILRVDSIIRDGLSPRIRHHTRAIPLANGKHALIIRAEQSWYGPHRVDFKRDSRFWGRTSNGKYELDVTNPRNAFLFSAGVADRISAFRAERTIAIENGRALIRLQRGPTAVFHCIPFEAFGAARQYDINTLWEKRTLLQPQEATRRYTWESRVNLEGVILAAAAGGDLSPAYAQLYRSSTIEFVHVLPRSPENGSLIPSLLLEQSVVTFMQSCFPLLAELGANPPFLIGLSLIHVRGMTMATQNQHQYLSRSIDRDVLLLPEKIVEERSVDGGGVLRTVFDAIWNACGILRSPNFDANGEWVAQRRGWPSTFPA
jgi:hypothetical protein